MTDQPDTCPNCHHDRHLPGTDCDAGINHGPNFHRCLCLARPGAALACPPQMRCQGGTLAYSDIWYLQHGHTLVSADGEIGPEALKVEPRGPQQTATPADRADLRDRIAEALYAHDHPNHLVPLNETGMGPAYRESADAVLPLLPAPVDRAAVYRQVADRLAADAEQGDKEGLTRIYRRSAARKVREWANELAAAEAQPTETDEQRADREETERDHARGDHTHCGITCETEMPTEHLRNFVIAKGYPGTKGALAELERRAAAEAQQDGAQS